MFVHWLPDRADQKEELLLGSFILPNKDLPPEANGMYSMIVKHAQVLLQFGKQATIYTNIYLERELDK